MKTYMNQGSTTALLNGLTAVAMFTVAAIMPEMAFAQATGNQDLVALTTQAAGESNGILQIVQVGAYVGGTIMGIATMLDAKKYSENPASNGPLGKVVGKGAVAAALLAAPSVLVNIQKSLVTQTNTLTPETLQGAPTQVPSGG